MWSITHTTKQMTVATTALPIPRMRSTATITPPTMEPALSEEGATAEREIERVGIEQWSWGMLLNVYQFLNYHNKWHTSCSYCSVVAWNKVSVIPLCWSRFISWFWWIWLRGLDLKCARNNANRWKIYYTLDENDHIVCRDISVNLHFRLQ